jgi:aspartokinase
LKYKVLKFGGSILKDRVDFMLVSEVIESEIREKNIPIPVVSAMKGVTDQIIEAVDSTYRRKPYDLEGFIDRLYSQHLKALPEGFEAPDSIRDELQQLKHVIEYIKNSGELTDSAYAYAVSRGEKYSCIVLAMHLSSRGVENICYPGEDILVTDENYRDALVDLELTGERLLERMGPTLGKGIIPVVAGFSGRSRSGRISTLGRGGSDDTAVCLGYCLGVNDVIKYVDQGGIMTIDPRFLKEIEENHPELHSMFGDLPEPELIPYLSYVEASELMREERIQVVHYKVLNPLIQGDIKFHVKDVTNPENPGSVIGPENGNNGSWFGRPKAISFQRNLAGIRLLPAQSHAPTEVYARVFQALADGGVDVRYISISGYQISLLMPETNVDAAIEALQGLELAVEVTKLQGRKATFSIVGSGMRGVRGFLSRVTGTLARHGVNIEQATQPYSENIIRFSVDDGDIPLAVSSVYKEFFG